MFDSYFARMRNYGRFGSRTSRRDFWMYSLVFAGLMVMAAILDAILGSETRSGGLVMGLIWVAHLAPNLAITAERLHDQDRTAWWLLLLLTGVGVIVILIFTLMPGTLGANRFGAAPVRALSTSAADQSSQSAVATPPAHPAPSEISLEIERLAALRTNGSISDEEFQMMKSRLKANGV